MLRRQHLKQHGEVLEIPVDFHLFHLNGRGLVPGLNEVHFNVIANPSSQWTAQQIVEAFSFNTAPRYLFRDAMTSTAPSSATECAASASKKC